MKKYNEMSDDEKAEKMAMMKKMGYDKEMKDMSEDEMKAMYRKMMAMKKEDGKGDDKKDMGCMEECKAVSEKCGKKEREMSEDEKKEMDEKCMMCKKKQEEEKKDEGKGDGKKDMDDWACKEQCMEEHEACMKDMESEGKDMDGMTEDEKKMGKECFQKKVKANPWGKCYMCMEKMGEMMEKDMEKMGMSGRCIPAAEEVKTGLVLTMTFYVDQECSELFVPNPAQDREPMKQCYKLDEDMCAEKEGECEWAAKGRSADATPHCVPMGDSFKDEWKKDEGKEGMDDMACKDSCTENDMMNKESCRMLHKSTTDMRAYKMAVGECLMSEGTLSGDCRACMEEMKKDGKDGRRRLMEGEEAGKAKKGKKTELSDEDLEKMAEMKGKKKEEMSEDEWAKFKGQMERQEKQKNSTDKKESATKGKE